jgi:putative ABC transport system permease protein
MLNLNLLALFRALPASVAQGMLWGIMAIGVYITFKILDFADLTVDGSLALGGAVAVMLIRSGMTPGLALCLAALSGLLVSLRHIPHTIFVGLLFLIVIVAILYWFFGTERGFTIRATGCNPAMARAQGISTNTAKVIALALSNALVGMAGGLIAQYQGSADVNMGRGAIVIGLAAVIIGQVIGGALLGKYLNFAGRLFFAAIGAIIYYLVITFVLWLGLPSDDMKLFSALVVAVFLAVPYLKGKYRTSFMRAAKLAKISNMTPIQKGDKDHA